MKLESLNLILLSLVFCFLISALSLLSVRKWNPRHKARSTTVENVRQIRLFLQNKPNFPHFSLENDDLTQKQTQYKPKQSQFWANIKGDKAKTKPIKPNLLESKELVDANMDFPKRSRMDRRIIRNISGKKPVRKPRSLRIKKLTIIPIDANFQI